MLSLQLCLSISIFEHIGGLGMEGDSFLGGFLSKLIVAEGIVSNISSYFSPLDDGKPLISSGPMPILVKNLSFFFFLASC